MILYFAYRDIFNFRNVYWQYRVCVYIYIYRKFELGLEFEREGYYIAKVFIRKRLEVGGGSG